MNHYVTMLVRRKLQLYIYIMSTALLYFNEYCSSHAVLCFLRVPLIITFTNFTIHESWKIGWCAFKCNHGNWAPTEQQTYGMEIGTNGIWFELIPQKQRIIMHWNLYLYDLVTWWNGNSVDHGWKKCVFSQEPNQNFPTFLCVFLCFRGKIPVVKIFGQPSSWVPYFFQACSRWWFNYVEWSK